TSAFSRPLRTQPQTRPDSTAGPWWKAARTAASCSAGSRPRNADRSSVNDRRNGNTMLPFGQAHARAEDRSTAEGYAVEPEDGTVRAATAAPGNWTGVST